MSVQDGIFHDDGFERYRLDGGMVKRERVTPRATFYRSSYIENLERWGLDEFLISGDVSPKLKNRLTVFLAGGSVCKR